MPNSIRIKRRTSGATGSPAGLLNAELAFNEVDNTLYYGYGDTAGSASSILAIAGPGAFATLNSAQTVTGDKTFSGNLIAVTQPGTDNSTKVATTAFVNSKLGNLTNVVNTFNARTGNVTLTSLDVTTALTYTPLATANSTGTDTAFDTYAGISYSLPSAVSGASTGGIGIVQNGLGGIGIAARVNSNNSNAAVLEVVPSQIAIAVQGDNGGSITYLVQTKNDFYFSQQFGTKTWQASSLLTRSYADTRYLQVTGGAYSGDLTISGNLTVNGTTVTINSTTLSVDDKSIELGAVAAPTDTTADGGGITLKGATDKTINWLSATGAWTSSENLSVATGKEYRISGVSVLSANTLGSGVTGSNLTSVGTITLGTWSATTISVNKGGTGATTLTGYVYGNGASAMTASTTIPSTAISGTMSVSQGGTGASTLTGYLVGNGASAITASSTIPGTAISGNISGNAANVAGTVAVANGGTGGTTAALGRSGLGAAASGANSDITSLTGLTTALTVAQGGTGVATITGLIKGSGTSAFSAATAGTDYLAPSSTIDGGTF